MNTSSWNFPNMINIAQNTIGIAKDSESIKNRLGLLIRTEPTELYMNPTFGVGLKRYIFEYNNEATASIVKQKLKEKIIEFEPCIVPDSIQFVDGVSTDQDSIENNNNSKLNITIAMETNYGETVELTV